jgi:hypothetical protein
VVSVTNGKEYHGEEIVPCHDVKLRAQCPAEILEEFKEGLGKRCFDKNGIPFDPEIGPMAWLPQYEGATMKISTLSFIKVELKKIFLSAIPGNLVDVELIARVKCDDDKAGRLAHLVGLEKTATFEKMTQKEISTEEEEGEDDEANGNGKQGNLKITPLLPPDKLEEAARNQKH